MVPTIWDDDLDDQEYNTNILNLPDDPEDVDQDNESDEYDANYEDQEFRDGERMTDEQDYIDLEYDR
jgi:hypothetical protein